MSEYVLYGFGESGNSYKAALMLELSGLDWSCRKVAFFDGETRSPEYRSQVNEMGEVPVLIHEDRKLTQSGVILDYLAGITGNFGPANEDERREILRWILFDNHKFTSYIATLRFLLQFAKSGETPVTEFLRGRIINSLKIVDGHLAKAPYIAAGRPTTADFSLCGYLYFGDELGVPLGDYPNIKSWLGRISALPGWKHPYELMPRAYQG
jgi:glutathione S-transferase